MDDTLNGATQADGPASKSTLSRGCPACQSRNHSPTSIERDEWRVLKCEACDFVYLSDVPGPQAFAEEFAWDKTVELEKKRRKREQPVLQWLDEKTRWRLHMFARPETRAFVEKLAPDGPVLDLGCGDGRHAMALTERFVPFGVEIAPNLAHAANEAFGRRGGFCLSDGSLTALPRFDDGLFAAAMLNSYLEHEPWPREVLSLLRPKMRQDGVVIIKVPNFGSWNAAVMGPNWCGVRLPDHVNYFTWRSLASLCADSGFRVEKPPAWVNLPTNDNMWAILRPA